DCPMITHRGAKAMEPTQISTAVLTIVNTSCIIQQYVQYLQNWARKRQLRDYYTDEDMDTDVPRSMTCGDWEIMVLLGQVHAVERRFWARETSTDWWDCIVFQKQVAIALWKLATPDSYQSVGNQFGVGKSTVGAAVMQVANAVIDQLVSRVVTLGNVQTIVDGFNALGFPNCGKVIDGTHIPILAPEHRGGQYVNRKGYFSMVLQALVDHRRCFTNINVKA
ncbi:unnamed protein product, partial [Eretmochelys imbricata]